MSKLTDTQLIEAYQNAAEIEDFDLKMSAMNRYGRMLALRGIDFTTL